MRVLFSVAMLLSLAGSPACGFDAKPLAGLPDAMARGDYPKTTSVVVVQDGGVVYERYFGDGSAGRLNNTRSATKIFAALAVGASVADGAIASERVPAFAFLSDLKPFANDTAEKEAITIQDMLTMSSALACDDNDDASPGNENNMHPQANWTRWAVDLPTTVGHARDGAGLGPWHYCTTNAFLTGQVVQRAVGMPVDRYIAKRVLRPLGIAGVKWSYSPAHETMTGGGLELRSRDWAKIAAMLADDGRWHGKQILPKAWVDAAFTVRRASRPDQNYGYFAFEGPYKDACGVRRVWYVAGNGGSQILILRDIHAAIVVTRENYNVAGSSAATQAMVEKYILPSLPCAKAA